MEEQAQSDGTVVVSKAARVKCHEARDAYYRCRAHGGTDLVCEPAHVAYLASCPAAWVCMWCI